MATNVQHEAIGVVSATKGEVFAKGADGQMRRLAVGDSVFEGDVIVTANGSSAEITPFSGPAIEIQEQQTVSIDSQVVPAAGNDATVGAVTPLGSTEAATVIQAVGAPQAGQDFNATLDDDATAAGLTGGDAGGGHSFVDLLRIVETIPGVGYDFPINPSGTSPIITGETAVPVTATPETPNDVLSPMSTGYTQIEGTEQSYTAIPGTSSVGSPANIVAGQYTGSLGTVVTVDAAGNFSYTAPVTDESKPEVFTFNTVDGNGATSTSTVTFGLIDTGVTSPATGFEVTEGSTAAYAAVLGSSLDNPVTVVAGQYTGSLGTTVTVDANGNFTYTAPVTDESKPEVFTFNTQDSDGSAGTSTVTFNLIDTGVTSPATGFEVTEGTTAAYAALLGTSLDNPVTVVAGQYTGSLGTVVTVDAQGNFTYTAPMTDESKPEIFTFNTQDGDGSAGTSTVTFNLLDTGVTSPATGFEVTEGTTAAYAALLGTSLDNPVTVVAGQYTGSLGTLVTIDAAGNFTYTAPVTDESKPEVFTFNTQDGDGSPGTSTVTFNLLDTGVTSPATGFEVTEGTTAAYAALLGSSLDNPVTVVAGQYTGSLGSTVTVDAAGNFTYTAPVTDESKPEIFTFNTQDGDGSPGTSTVTFNLIDTGVTSPETGFEVTEGTTAAYAALLGTSLDNPVTVVAGQYTGSLGTVVTVDAGGNFTYTAPIGDERANPNEIFTFNTQDSDGSPGTSTVTFNLIDTGVTSPSTGFEVTEGTTAAFTALLGTSVDNPVTMVAGEYTGSLGTVVTVDAAGNFSYTAPVTDESKPEVFTFNTQDGDGSPGTSTVTFNLIDTGVTSPSTGFEVTEGSTAEFAALLGTSLDNPVAMVAGQYTGSLGTVVTVDAAGHFSYTAPVTDESKPEVFTFNTQDGDGSPGTSTVTFNLLDVGPTAVDDNGGTATEDAAPNMLSGNVLSNDNAGLDTPPSLVSWDSASAAAAHAALDPYGALTFNPDGSWSFVLDNSLAAVQALKSSDTITETVGYTMQDADGTTSQAALTITIQGADDSASVITASATGADATVYEHGLLSAADASETTSGTFTVTASDGIANIIIGGTTGGPTTVTLDQLNHLGSNPISMDTGEGTLTLTGYNATSHDVSYTYTLKAAIGSDAAGYFDDGLTATVNGIGGTTASDSLVIRVMDDAPAAANDGPNIVTEDATQNAVSGNVLTNDSVGADTPVGSVAWNGASVAAAHAALDPYGTLTLNNDGTWSFALDNSLAAVQALTSASIIAANIGYTMQDADATASNATLTITVKGADDSASVVTASATGADATVYEHGLLSVADTSETTSGTFAVTATDGIANIVIGGTTGGPTTVTLDQLNHLGSTPISMDTGEGTLTLTGYNSASGVVNYSYVLKAAIGTDAPGSFDDSLTVTVNGVGGTQASDNLVVRIMDDTPTFTRIDNAILGNSAGAVFGTHDISFGADGEQSINVSALTQISGLNYSAVHHNLDGSAYVTAGAGTSDSGFFTLKVNPDGTYEFDLLNARPTVEHTVTFPSVQGGQGVPSLTIGSGTDSITFTGLGGDTIKPTSAGFGVNDGNLNSGDDFRITFGNALVDSITMGVKQQASSAFTLNWSTDTGESGQASFSANGDLTINPVNDFTSMTINVTGGNAKMDSFSYGEHLLPPDQTLQFNVSATDGDGDVSATQMLSVTLTGGIAGSAISGTSADETILGTASGETISGGGGSDALTGGLGADTFVWHLADLGTSVAPAHDVVTDFSAAQGDVLNLGDVLSTGNTLTAIADSGHLVVQISSGTGVVQDIALQTVAVADNAAAATMLNNMLNSHQILTNG
jgi:VCBS repeat-containing protein